MGKLIDAIDNMDKNILSIKESTNELIESIKKMEESVTNYNNAVLRMKELQSEKETSN